MSSPAFHLEKEATKNGGWLIVHTLVCLKMRDCLVNLYVIDASRHLCAATAYRHHRMHPSPGPRWPFHPQGVASVQKVAADGKASLPAAGVSPGRLRIPAKWRSGLAGPLTSAPALLMAYNEIMPIYRLDPATSAESTIWTMQVIVGVTIVETVSFNTLAEAAAEINRLNTAQYLKDKHR
jgi:hypothetical protein